MIIENKRQSWFFSTDFQPLPKVTVRKGNQDFDKKTISVLFYDCDEKLEKLNKSLKGTAILELHTCEEILEKWNFYGTSLFSTFVPLEADKTKVMTVWQYESCKLKTE